MNWFQATWLIVPLLVSGPPTAGAQDNERLPIRIYSAAGVPDRTVDMAVEEAARILAAAGVPTEWKHGSADADEAHVVDFTGPSTASVPRPDTRACLVVRIVRQAPPGLPRNALGMALPFARAGVHVTVFDDRVRKAVTSSQVPLARIMGAALAHEIAHVLLPGSRHSAGGITKGGWNYRDFQLAAQGSLLFDEAEARSLREHVRKRLAESHPELAAQNR